MSEAPTSAGALPSSGAEGHSKGAIRRVSKTRQNSVGSSHREDVFTLVPTKSEVYFLFYFFSPCTVL